MREAYARKQDLEFCVVLEVVRIIRRVVPGEVFILCAAPGTFDEPEPHFQDWQAEELSEAGADGLFIEKSDYAEVEHLTRMAHKVGLLTQAGCQLRTKGMQTAVIPIEKPADAENIGKRLVNMGVDIVGLRFSGINAYLFL